MNKPDILISIQPTWVEKIFNKIKVIDVRKTKPKSEPPFKCLIYCSNNKSIVLNSDHEAQKFWTEKSSGDKHFYNGKVVGEFICDKIESYINKAEDGNYYWSFRSAEHIQEIKQKTCLSIEQLIEYASDNNFLYGWHISELKIYDKPKELFEFLNYNKHQLCLERNCFSDNCFNCWNNAIMVRPPQSWCYVEE